jgi:hypothetical protein
MDLNLAILVRGVDPDHGNHRLEGLGEGALALHGRLSGNEKDGVVGHEREDGLEVPGSSRAEPGVHQVADGLVIIHRYFWAHGYRVCVCIRFSFSFRRAR